MSKRMRKFTTIQLLKWLGDNRVVLFFSSGKVMEVALPWVNNARKARIVDDGGALDPGNHKDVGADTVAMLPGRVLLPGLPGWIGS